MSAGYRQQPGKSSEKRTDGKRVAGKQAFPPPGSGGSNPTMKPRDLNFIPESVGGKEPQPAGSHIHDRIRTGTVVGKPLPLVDSNAKVTGQAWYGDDVRLANETIGKILHESKDVIKFDEKWVGKLLNDMSREDATIGIIFTEVMPSKSNGLVEEREGGRIIICSEYPIYRQMISTHRKLIKQIHLNKLNNSDASSKLENLYNYINSNEFKLQYRKAMKGINKEGYQIDKDERSYEIQIKNRKQNHGENKKNITSIITSIISNSHLSEDLLDIDDTDNLIE